MILSYNNFLLEREQRDASLFNKDEKELFEDLLQEYIDKYSMIEMPIDHNQMHFFDETIPRIQYLVQRLRNVSIEIESSIGARNSINDIPLTEIYKDLITHFVPRLKKYGYQIMGINKWDEYNKHCISIVVTKDESYPRPQKKFENIQQGKSIITSNNISSDDPRWLRILSIFERNPGYVGDFTFLVFEKDWTLESIEYIYNTFINNQSNKGIFNQLYPKIRTYSEESFIDELQKLKGEKDVLSIYNKFPSLQKELIDKSTQKNRILYDLSLRKDINSFIRKISRYHTTRDLVNAAKLFLSSKVLDGHNQILNRVNQVGAKIIVNDESNNLIIIKVDYPKLRQLASHTSWCILSEGTFDSYNRVCDQFIIYFTDETGNKSMIGTTIGKNVRTSHYINDEFVSTDTLKKLLSERGFNLSKLFMSEKEFLLKNLSKERFSILIQQGFKKEQIFSVKTIFLYSEFKEFDEGDIKKYKLKYRDSGHVIGGISKVIDDFKSEYVADISYHIVDLYKQFGNKIIPFISSSYDFTKFPPSIIELVEEIEDHKFTDFEEIMDRVTRVDADFISFMIKRDIKFTDRSIAKSILSEKYGNNFQEILGVRPQLFDYLIPALKELRSGELFKIKEIPELKDNKELDTLISEKERSENLKYVTDIVPDYCYQNSGIGRREHINFLKKEDASEFGPEQFMSNDIWGRIKKYKLRNSYRDRYSLFFVFSCVKLNKLDDIKELFPLTYEFIGQIIRTAIYRPGGPITYSYNGTPYVTKPFFLNDEEEEKLFQWLLMNVSEQDARMNIYNAIYNKSLMRHYAFSLIYYKYGWGFNKYVDIVSKVKPIQSDKWTKNEKGEDMVQNSITRPQLFTHIIKYLTTMNMREELYDLMNTAFSMKLKLYEARSLFYIYRRSPIEEGRNGMSSYQNPVSIKIKEIFLEHGFKINNSMDDVSNLT